MQESRTTKSIKTAEVSIIYYTLNLIVGFWSRKVFYDYLGSEVLGLDTTASTLLSFLNLAELGVGASVAFFLSQPMFNKDTLTINEIVSLQGWIYRRVAYVIMAAAVILMCFFPVIFAKIDLPQWYPYATFLVMLFGSLLGYFINYRQCVLSADQKGYKVTRVTSGANLLFKIILILILPYVPCPFLFYLGTNLIGTIFGSLWLNHVLKTEYPWLHRAELNGKQLLKRYPDVLKKTSQLFFHQITTFIVFKVAPLIMYAYTSLTAIAYYGNYLTIVDKAKDILDMAFGSTQAAIGNLIASHDKNRIMDVYWELTDSRLCISSASLMIIGLITEPLISVWLSPKYLLSSSVLSLVVINSWLYINRRTNDSYINGYGIFQDIWAPAVEGLINFGVAIFFGRLYGIAGVLSGTTASTLIIVYGWKPYFLFHSGIHLHPLKDYYLPISGRWLLVAINAFLFFFFNEMFSPAHFHSFFDVALYGLVISLIIFPIMYVQFYLLTPGTRAFHKRIVNLISVKFHKSK